MRKVIRITAEQLEAGDRLVVMDGTIRKYCHVCEIFRRGDDYVHFAYDTPQGKVSKTAHKDKILRVREL